MQQLINQSAKILGYFHAYEKKPDEIRNQLQIGSLSNGVDDLENFTSEMEWSFFVPVGFSCVFFKVVQLRINTACVSAGVDSCMNSCR